MIHIVKGFSIVNEAEVDIFLEFSCFFYDPTDVGNLISGSSAFSKFEKLLTPWKQSYDKPRQHIKNQRHHFTDKGLYSQSYGFSSSHVQMWELDHKEGWAPENWHFQIVVLEKTLESLLESKEIKLVSVLKEINPECSLEGLLLKPNLQ